MAGSWDFVLLEIRLSDYHIHNITLVLQVLMKNRLGIPLFSLRLLKKLQYLDIFKML